MKKFFAYHTPIVGEIEENYSELYRAVDPNRIFEYKGKRMKWELDGSVTPVQFSLCTKDVEIGDVVFHLPDTNLKLKFEVIGFEGEDKSIAIIKYIEHPADKFIGTTREWSSEALFKVIGVISPKVYPFIKEWDQFDEDQIKIEHIGLDAFGEGDWSDLTYMQWMAKKEEFKTRGVEYEHISTRIGGGKRVFFGNVLLKCPWGCFH